MILPATKVCPSVLAVTLTVGRIAADHKLSEAMARTVAAIKTPDALKKW